jgi:hypothetical protein
VLSVTAPYSQAIGGGKVKTLSVVPEIRAHDDPPIAVTMFYPTKMGLMITVAAEGWEIADGGA